MHSPAKPADRTSKCIVQDPRHRADAMPKTQAAKRDIKEVWIEYKKTQDRAAAQHPDGELSPSRALQRRAHPRQAAG